MSMPTEIAVSIALSGYPERYSEIDQIEAWYWGVQYKVTGPWYREHAWSKETDGNRYIPLAERRPYDFGIAKSLVDQSTSFLFDEGRFPQIVVDGGDDKAAAAQLWLRQVAEHVRLRIKMLQASRVGGRCRSVFVYFKLVDGEPIVDVHSGKLCTPTFGPDGKTLKLVRQQYKARGADLQLLGFQDLDPQKLYWYRHDFTPSGEIAYAPVEAKPGPNPPVFIQDTERSVTHNLGFVTGVWMVNIMAQEQSYDGYATYEGENVLSLINLCNEVLSQGHRATRNASDPQYVNEIPVPNFSDIDPDELKRQHKGGVWRVPGTLKAIEMTGAGQKLGLSQFDAYRKLIAEATGVHEVDPENLSGRAQSGEALRVLFSGLISFTSVLRISYGDDGIVPLCKVILRVLKATANDTVNVDVFDEDGQPVPRHNLPDRPRIRLEWGEWFAPTAADKQATITSTAAALGAGILSRATAVSFVARLYGRDGVEELQAILDEEAEKAQSAMREAQATQDGLKEVEQADEQSNVEGIEDMPVLG